MKWPPTAWRAAKVTAAKVTSKVSGADEVAAHSLAGAKVTAAKVTSKVSDADEVAAHLMVRASRVVLDESKQSYKLS